MPNNYRRLNFFDKKGDPLNFEYINGPAPDILNIKFNYIVYNNVDNQGALKIENDALPNEKILTLNILDNNGYNINEWALNILTLDKEGSDITIKGNVLSKGEFIGKIDDIILENNKIVLFLSNFKGIIPSEGSKITFETLYNNTPGGYFKGKIYFDKVSVGLYENEQIFITQKFIVGPTGDNTIYEHGFPHSIIQSAPGATAEPGKWRTRWYNDSYGEIDVSDIIFTYKIEEDIVDGKNVPYIINYPNMIYEIESSEEDYDINNGYIETNKITPKALSINVALNSSLGYGDIYERKLILEDISSGEPIKILELDFYGDIIDEDERFKVMLANIGRQFNQEDSLVLRNHDLDEALPDYKEINEKRKELLLAGDEIFPYIGSYKGLINALKFFGYQDLKIKEYWLNLKEKHLKIESPLQLGKDYLQGIRSGKSKNYINDIIENPNNGKYTLTQTYGPNDKGEYVLDLSQASSLVPNTVYKKTSLFGLYYNINKVKTSGEVVDEFGYPIVEDVDKFTSEEVLIKLYGLKERLKKDYLPLNARIIDITGEGIYFGIYNTKSWIDIMNRFDVNIGDVFSIRTNPDFGFIEDLRFFNNQNVRNIYKTNNQIYEPIENNSLITDIKDFYIKKQKKEIINLEDNIGEIGEISVGMPVILELFYNASIWNSITSKYEYKNIPIYDILEESEFIEIEWNIKKSDNKNQQYNFTIKGLIKDYYNLAHFVPYIGTYDVKCTIYDSFNTKNIVISRKSINVNPKSININALTRYNENEFYTIDSMYRTFNEYEGTYMFPSEGLSTKNIEDDILNDIKNIPLLLNINDPQVKIKKKSVGSSGYITLSQKIIRIDEIYSNEIISEKFSLARVKCSSAHGLQNGDTVTILNTIKEIEGRWIIQIESENVFILPFEIKYNWDFVELQTTPVKKLFISNIIYNNQYITGNGYIEILIDDKKIGGAQAGDTIHNTVNSLLSSINNLKTYPDYFGTFEYIDNGVKIIISASDSFGDSLNGKLLTYNVSGFIEVIDNSDILSGGTRDENIFVSLSNINNKDDIKYFGMDTLIWDNFNTNTFDDFYAHDWYDFDFNNDYLGGYDLYHINAGDNIKLIKYGYQTDGIIIDDDDLTLGNIADILNASDDIGISSFHYNVIPYDFNKTISVESCPININIDSVVIDNSEYIAPESITGIGELIPNFEYNII